MDAIEPMMAAVYEPTCLECGGTGFVAPADDTTIATAYCRRCHGAGFALVWPTPCPYCAHKYPWFGIIPPDCPVCRPIPASYTLTTASNTATTLTIQANTSAGGITTSGFAQVIELDEDE